MANKTGFHSKKNTVAEATLEVWLPKGHRKAYTYLDRQLLAVVQLPRCGVPSLLLPDLTFSKNHCAALH